MPTFVDQSHHQQSMEESISRLMWVAILKNKSEAFGAFKKFKTLAESKSNGALIKCLRNARGGEFTSEEFSKWCEFTSKEFTFTGRQLTTTHTPQQNAIVITCKLYMKIYDC